MSKRNYSLEARSADRVFPAPRLSYQPRHPKRYRAGIGMIGCGGITASHLDAYRAAGWKVVAVCDKVEAAARKRRDEFCPGAEVYTDYRSLLARDDVDVVDVALHPKPRYAAIEAALNAGKHVLSQKPLALDLDAARRLVALADRRRRKFAVNQNGRWSPYASYAACAIRNGLIGDVQTVSMTLNWDHTWIKGTPFEQVHHVVLYDFGIHWFDMAVQFFAGREPLKVFAVNGAAVAQELKSPMIGSAVVQFENGTATMSFDAYSRFGPEESICITGSAGTIRATRSDLRGARSDAAHRARLRKTRLKGQMV